MIVWTLLSVCVCVCGGGGGGYWKMVRFVWEGGGGGRGVLIFTMECQKLPIEKNYIFNLTMMNIFTM